MPDGARRGSGEVLSEQDSKALLQSYGIAVPAERVVTSAAEAARAAKGLGFPVVMKIVSADIAHKSDLGLVAVGWANLGVQALAAVATAPLIARRMRTGLLVATA